MQVPTEKEINVYDSLDEKTAVEHFLGKSLEDAEELFRDNSTYYQEDLMWMGPKAFTFYFEAVYNYLKSEYSDDDDHFVFCLYLIITFRIENDGLEFSRHNVIKVIDHIIHNYGKFSVDQNIYGDLSQKFIELREKIKDSK